MFECPPILKRRRCNLFCCLLANLPNSAEEALTRRYQFADVLYENRPLLFKVTTTRPIIMFPLSTKNPTCVKEMECIDSTSRRLFFNTVFFFFSQSLLYVDIINLNKNRWHFDFKNKPPPLKPNLHRCWVTAMLLAPSND